MIHGNALGGETHSEMDFRPEKEFAGDSFAGAELADELRRLVLYLAESSIGWRRLVNAKRRHQAQGSRALQRPNEAV